VPAEGAVAPVETVEVDVDDEIPLLVAGRLAGEPLAMPAFATRMSTRPCFSASASATSVTWADLVTSSRTNSAG